MARVRPNTNGAYLTPCGIPSGSVCISGSFSESSKIDEIDERLKRIEEHIGILADPDPEILERYVALRSAYKKYKVIEKLILGGSSE